MRGGHNAKPVEQRLAEGNRGKRKIPKTPSIGDVIEHGHEPEPPEHIDVIGAAAWRRLAPLLTRIRILRTGDLDAFEALCESISAHYHASQEVKTYREAHATSLIAGARGQQAHPMIAVARAERQTMLRYFERFGIDPQSRTRLGHAGETGDGDVEPEDDIPELADLIPIDGGAA